MHLTRALNYIPREYYKLEEGLEVYVQVSGEISKSRLRASTR